MKILKPVVAADFSDAAVEQAIIDIENYTGKHCSRLILNVSIFDATHALTMLIDKRYFRGVSYIHVTPEFKEGEFSVQDDLNSVVLKSGGT